MVAEEILEAEVEVILIISRKIIISGQISKTIIFKGKINLKSSALTVVNMGTIGMNVGQINLKIRSRMQTWLKIIMKSKKLNYFLPLKLKKIY